MVDHMSCVEFLNTEWDPHSISNSFNYRRTTRSLNPPTSSHNTSVINTSMDLYLQVPSMNTSPVTLYKCKVCRKAYLKQVNLERHERSHEDQPGEVKNVIRPSVGPKSKPDQEEISVVKPSTKTRSKAKASLKGDGMISKTTSTAKSKSLPKSSRGDKDEEYVSSTTSTKSKSSPVSCNREQVQEVFTKITRAKSKQKPESCHAVQVEAVNNNKTPTKESKSKLSHRDQVEKVKNNETTTKSRSKANLKLNAKKRSQPTMNPDSTAEDQTGSGSLNYLNPEIEKKIQSTIRDNCMFDQDTEMLDSDQSNTVMEWCSAEKSYSMFDITQKKFKAFLKPAQAKVKMESEQLDDVQSQVNNILNFLNSEEEVNDDPGNEQEPENTIPEIESEVTQQKNSSPDVNMGSDRGKDTEEKEEEEDETQEEDPEEENKEPCKDSERNILKVKITKKSTESNPKGKGLEDSGSNISKEREPVEEQSEKPRSKTDLMEKDGDLKSCSSEDDLQNEDEDIGDNDGSDHLESDKEEEDNERSETNNENVTEPKSFDCFICGEKFPSKGKVKFHRKKHYFPLWPEGEEIRCDECGKTVKTRSALISHKKSHLSKRRVKCNVCGKTFSEALYLRKHLCTNERKVKHICELCGSTFKKKYYLNEHILKEHDDKTYDCEQCGKSFQHPSNLRKHVLTHIAAKSFICDLCGRGFTFSGTLRRHMKIHSDDKPFKCITCGKLFRNKYNLNSHMLVHTKEKPFRCHLCPEAFNHKVSLQSHVKKCHECDLD